VCKKIETEEGFFLQIEEGFFLQIEEDFSFEFGLGSFQVAL